MKRYLGDPTPALKRPEPALPLSQRILCAIVVAVLVAGAVYVSVVCGP